MFDATAMREAIVKGELSPKELVQQTINKAEALNPKLNAITSRRYEKALEEAESRDFSDLPFGGVPIFLKDIGQEQEGEPSSGGSILFKDKRVKASDNYVKQLLSLGFIVLGRSNVPEFGFKNITDSAIFGNTNLPDDLTRNSGGSSGGAAALVSSGIVPIAGASDGGGSIRIPSSFNGVIGLKPTRGRLPVGPGNYRGWQGASINFAITKSIRDTKAFLYGMQTLQWESPFLLPTLTQEQLNRPLDRKLKIALQLDSPVGSKVSEEALISAKKAARFLEEKGHHVELLTRPIIDGKEAMRSYFIMNAVETAAMFDQIEKELGRNVTKEDMELMTWAIYRSGQKIPAKRYSEVLNAWDNDAVKWEEFFQDYDLVLSPTVAHVAPKHGQFDLSQDLEEKLAHIDDNDVETQQDLIWEMFYPELQWSPFTQQANLTGEPAITLPIYRNEEGLSIGSQLVAPKGREDLLLQVAEIFEQEGQFLIHED